MKIWAHRGCSLKYPENTLPAFSAAAKLANLTGIELDVQLTKDNQPVVIHDETVDRTTNGKGFVKDYQLDALKKLRIKRNLLISESIPSLSEVLELLEKPMSKGLLLNIELKNSIVPYESMEKIITEMIRANGLRGKVIFSSFNAESLKKLRQLQPDAVIGILDGQISNCLAHIKKGCPADDLHPNWNGMDIDPEQLSGYNIRAYGSCPLFPAAQGTPLDLSRFESLGITDVFVNEPERYLRTMER